MKFNVLKGLIILGAGIFALNIAEVRAESPEQSGTSSNERFSGQQAVTEQGDPNWFLNMDYSGFNFRIPAGSIVEKGSSFVAKYPDGTFGVSMKNEGRAMNQKIAYEECKRMVQSLGMTGAQVRKDKFGKCNGAKATGEVGGQKVSVFVMPYDDQTVTGVVLASPERENWLGELLRSLSR